jgi:hypothetical protein
MAVMLARVGGRAAVLALEQEEELEAVNRALRVVGARGLGFGLVVMGVGAGAGAEEEKQAPAMTIDEAGRGWENIVAAEEREQESGRGDGFRGERMELINSRSASIGKKDRARYKGGTMRDPVEWDRARPRLVEEAASAKAEGGKEGDMFGREVRGLARAGWKGP